MTVKKETAVVRYIGLSSDTKPTGTTVPIGSTFLEYDTGTLFITYDGTTWVSRDSRGDKEYFIFRPGAGGLASGMVAAGTRSYSPITASTTTVSGTTVWSGDITYDPYTGGLIDGISASGTVYGQLTLGYIAVAAGANAKLTARIRNHGGTYTTMLGLTGTISASTAVAYQTYDIPYLQTTSNFNSVPFDIGVGVQSDASGNSIQVRMMESSWIAGEYIPGTS